MNAAIKEHVYPSGHKLQLAQGDITKETVDIIVNAANAHLAHGAGVAGAIVRQGGAQIQKESDQWVDAHGPVTHDMPAFTSGGKLACRYVIHAVGPRWGEGDEKVKLKAAVRGSLTRAEQLGVSSIAFPAISTGIFGFPVPLAAQVMLSTIDEYLNTRPTSLLKLIRIVLYDREALQVFIHTWEQDDHFSA
jgi:O-acetyl-ADP-ribose deacetylase (regulator of RNase III)